MHCKRTAAISTICGKEPIVKAKAWGVSVAKDNESHTHNISRYDRSKGRLETKNGYRYVVAVPHPLASPYSVAYSATRAAHFTLSTGAEKAMTEKTQTFSFENVHFNIQTMFISTSQLALFKMVTSTSKNVQFNIPTVAYSNVHFNIQKRSFQHPNSQLFLILISPTFIVSWFSRPSLHPKASRAAALPDANKE